MSDDPMSDDPMSNEGSDRPASSRQEDTVNKITLGSINGVFGVKGWVKVFSETEPRENVVEYKSWWIRRGATGKARSGSSGSEKEPASSGVWRQIEVLEGRRQGKTVIARLAGVENPEQAALLIGHEIAVDRHQMPSLNPGEYYWADLIGHTVLSLDGNKLGTVERLFATGANDVVVVRRNPALRSGGAGTGGKSGKGNNGDVEYRDAGAGKSSALENELLIPWIMDSVIIEVDIASHRIVVDWDPDF